MCDLTGQGGLCWGVEEASRDGGDRPALSQGAQCDHQDPRKRGTGGSESVTDVTTEARGWRDARKGHRPGDVCGLWKPTKARKGVSPQRLQKDHNSANTLPLGQLRPDLDFSPPELQADELVLF